MANIAIKEQSAIVNAETVKAVAEYDSDGRLAVSTEVGQPIAEEEDIAQALFKVMTAFPSVFGNKTEKDLKAFKMLFTETVAYKRMSKRQLQKAVMECIANRKQYKDFCIADITSCCDNEKIRFYTYKEADGGRDDRFISTSIRFKATGQIAYVRVQDREAEIELWKNGLREV